MQAQSAPIGVVMTGHEPLERGVDEGILGHRLGEQIALPDIATDALQLVTFVRRFDALGNGLQSEALAELDDGLAQTRIDAVGCGNW